MMIRTIFIKRPGGGPSMRVRVHHKRPRAQAAVAALLRAGISPIVIRHRLKLSARSFALIRHRISTSVFKI